MTTNQRPSEEEKEKKEEELQEMEPVDVEESDDSTGPSEQAPAEEKQEETPELEAVEETPVEPTTEPVEDTPKEETTPEEPVAETEPEESKDSSSPQEQAPSEPEAPVEETEPPTEEPEVATEAEPEPVEEVTEEVVEETTEEIPEEPAAPESEPESAPEETTPTPALEETSSPVEAEDTPEDTPAEGTPTEKTPKPSKKAKKTKKSILVEEEKIVLDHDPKEEMAKDSKGNKMREVFIEKIVVNIGVGEAGDKLQRAEKVLKLLCDQAPTRTLSRTTNRDFGVRKLMPIGCKVTLRRDDAVKFLKEAFWVKENRIAGYSFDREGNFSFGIPDYTSFPDQKYDPDIGIFGMDICVTMARPGKRVGRRKRARARVPTRHRIYPDLTKDYIRVNFDVEVVEE